MAKMEIWNGSNGSKIHVFECPGCKCCHGIWVNQPHQNGSQWEFNGDFDNPTVHPSLLIHYGVGKICHSFVQEGKIQFLGDCTHELCGQTVDLPKMSPDSPDINNGFVKYR